MSSGGLSNLATAILVACALAVTGMLARRELFTTKDHPGDSPIRLAETDVALAHDGGHVIGDSTAPILIVEFSDFQCPYCGYAYRILSRLMRQYPRQFAIISRSFPLPSHPRAFDAAIAAECAAVQGHYAVYRERLFEMQDSLAWIEFGEVAREVGIEDLRSYLVCLNSQEAYDLVRNDLAVGRQLGVTGTPSYVVGASLFKGIPEEEALEMWIRSGHQ